MSQQLPEADLEEAIAAIDLGSNSFHLVDDLQVSVINPGDNEMKAV